MACQQRQSKLSPPTFPSQFLGLTYGEVISFVPPPLDQEEMESWAPGFCSDPTSLWGEGLFMGTLQISFKCLLLQRFPPWWKGRVCVSVSMCAWAHMHAHVCACACALMCVCLCGRVREGEQTMIAVTLCRGKMLRGSLCLLFVRVRLGRQELPSHRVC